MKLQKWYVLFSLLLVAGFVVWLTTGAPLAADLNPGNVGARCNGTGTWHFVNNQTENATGGTLTAIFSCGTITTDITSHVNRGTVQWEITTTGNCTLENATTDLPGRLQLSDFFCTAPTPTPTPSPTPTPRPTPTPTP